MILVLKRILSKGLVARIRVKGNPQYAYSIEIWKREKLVLAVCVAGTVPISFELHSSLGGRQSRRCFLHCQVEMASLSKVTEPVSHNLSWNSDCPRRNPLPLL